MPPAVCSARGRFSSTSSLPSVSMGDADPLGRIVDTSALSAQGERGVWQRATRWIGRSGGCGGLTVDHFSSGSQLRLGGRSFLKGAGAVLQHQPPVVARRGEHAEYLHDCSGSAIVPHGHSLSSFRSLSAPLDPSRRVGGRSVVVGAIPAPLCTLDRMDSGTRGVGCFRAHVRSRSRRHPSPTPY